MEHENEELLSGGELNASAIKKGLSLAVLQVLKQESDAAHPLRQKDIQEFLSDVHHMEADRKTLRLHLRLLTEMGYPIEHVAAGWYYEHEFTQTELSLLIDSLPPGLSSQQRQQLIHKLCSLGSIWFSRDQLHREEPGSSELLLTLQVLQEAIRKGLCVSFCYGRYDIDKQLHIKTHHDGTPREYIVSPYRTVMSSGHCMLLGNTRPYDGITVYRLDRIRGMKLLENEPARPLNQVSDQLADMAAYLSQRPYMYSDDPVNVRFVIERKYIGDVLDWFGTGVKFKEQADKEHVQVFASVSPTAMKFWALQYGEVCEVISPKSLRSELASIAADMAARYSQPAARPERKTKPQDPDTLKE